MENGKRTIFRGRPCPSGTVRAGTSILERMFFAGVLRLPHPAAEADIARMAGGQEKHAVHAMSEIYNAPDNHDCDYDPGNCQHFSTCIVNLIHIITSKIGFANEL